MHQQTTIPNHLGRLFNSTQSKDSTQGLLHNDSIAHATQRFIEQPQKPSTPATHTNPVYAHSWILLILICCTGLIAIIRATTRKRLHQFINAFFSLRHINQLIREGNPLNERISLLLSVNSILVLALTSWLFLHQYPSNLFPGYSELSRFGIITAIISVFWATKILLIQLIGKIFKTPQATYLYLVHSTMINNIGGLLYLPVLIFMAYAPIPFLFPIAFGLLGLLYLMKLGRAGLAGWQETKFSKLHLFLYLCALEILPLALIFKILLTS